MKSPLVVLDVNCCKKSDRFLKSCYNGNSVRRLCREEIIGEPIDRASAKAEALPMGHMSCTIYPNEYEVQNCADAHGCIALQSHQIKDNDLAR